MAPATSRHLQVEELLRADGVGGVDIRQLPVTQLPPDPYRSSKHPRSVIRATPVSR